MISQEKREQNAAKMFEESMNTLYRLSEGGSELEKKDGMKAAIFAFENWIQTVETLNVVYVCAGLFDDLFDQVKILKEGDILQLDRDHAATLLTFPEKDGGESIALCTRSSMLPAIPSAFVLNVEAKPFVESVIDKPGFAGFRFNSGHNGILVPARFIRKVLEEGPSVHETPEEADRIIENCALYVCEGDLLKMNVEAVVNLTDEHFSGSGRLDGSVQAAAGLQFERLFEQHGALQTGKAVCSRVVWKYASSMVIHTVGPLCFGRRKDCDLLFSCYWNCLELACDQVAESVAFPLISAGEKGFPIDEAARTAALAIRIWAHMHPQVAMKIVLVGKDRISANALRKAIEEVC